MLSPDGRIVIVFNGEIYNFRELRRDLERLGWAFRTRSDTEVLIAGYAIWAFATSRAASTHAAFALWTPASAAAPCARPFRRQAALSLARGGSLMFASEIKAFLATRILQCVNDSALREYFTFQNLFRPHTLFTGVEQLPPATILSVDAPANGARPTGLRLLAPEPPIPSRRCDA